MDFLDQFFTDDPAIPDDEEHATHIWVAGIVGAALLFLIAVKAGMKSAAM